MKNLQRMRQFAAYYSHFEIVPQAVAQLLWSYISSFIYKAKVEIVRHHHWYQHD